MKTYKIKIHKLKIKKCEIKGNHYKNKNNRKTLMTYIKMPN